MTFFKRLFAKERVLMIEGKYFPQVRRLGIWFYLDESIVGVDMLPLKTRTSIKFGTLEAAKIFLGRRKNTQKKQVVWTDIDT